MRVPTKSGLAIATILAASFGFASVTQAVPLAGVAAAVPAMQMTQEPSALEALPEKAHYQGHPHHPYGYGHRGYGHHGYSYGHHSYGYGHHGYGHHGYGYGHHYH
jgi:hypothetical protein